MQSICGVRSMTNVIAKRTSTTVTAKTAVAEQFNNHEKQCPYAVQNDQVPLSSKSSTKVPFTYETVRPYNEIPGPKPLPILGNTWR